MISKVISGGQTGGDMGGLRAAKELGIQTGGYCPRGYKTEKGYTPILKEYGLIQTKSSGYLIRTAKNTATSDGTMGFGKANSPGMKNTYLYCKDHKKPSLHFNNPEKLDNNDIKKAKEWIIENNIRILNIAGNRESGNKELEEAVKNFLLEVLKY